MKSWVVLSVALAIQFGKVGFIQGQTNSKPEILGSPVAIVYDIELIEEKELLIANLVDNVQVWNYQTKVLINSWSASQVVAIDYSNNKLVGVSKSGNMTVWSIPDGKEMLQQKVSESPLISVAWIDAVFLAVGSDNGDLMKINSVSGETVSLIKNRAAITAIAAGEDNILITGDANGTVATYNSEGMRLESAVPGHRSWVRDIKFSNSGQVFASVSDDGRFTKWKSGKEIMSTKMGSSGSWLLSTDFIESSEPGFNIIASGNRNGEVNVTTRFGDYKYHFNSLVNSVDIIKEELPRIFLALGTHGEGIQLLYGRSMKLKSK